MPQYTMMDVNNRKQEIKNKRQISMERSGKCREIMRGKNGKRTNNEWGAQCV